MTDVPIASVPPHNPLKGENTMTTLDIRVEALRLANISGGSPEEIVAKAEKFYQFLISEKPREEA